MSESNHTVPGLRGKTVVVFTRGNSTTPLVLDGCILETRGNRLFLAGASMPTHKGQPDWTEGIRRAVAWDAVEQYLLFDSPEDYYARAEAPEPASEILEMPTQPLFESPQGEEGFPVEPSGIHMEPETPLEAGAMVLAFSQGRWWRAEVVAVEDDMVTLHYPGWDSKWDVTVPKTDLQVYLGDSIEEVE